MLSTLQMIKHHTVTYIDPLSLSSSSLKKSIWLPIFVYFVIHVEGTIILLILEELQMPFFLVDFFPVVLSSSLFFYFEMSKKFYFLFLFEV